MAGLQQRIGLQVCYYIYLHVLGIFYLGQHRSFSLGGAYRRVNRWLILNSLWPCMFYPWMVGVFVKARGLADLKKLKIYSLIICIHCSCYHAFQLNPNLLLEYKVLFMNSQEYFHWICEDSYRRNDLSFTNFKNSIKEKHIVAASKCYCIFTSVFF